MRTALRSDHLRNLYPILNEYYYFVFNEGEDFEVVVTIVSINQKPINNNTSSPSNNSTIINEKDKTKLPDVQIIVDKTINTSVLLNRNDQIVNADDKATDDNNK